MSTAVYHKHHVPLPPLHPIILTISSLDPQDPVAVDVPASAAPQPADLSVTAATLDQRSTGRRPRLRRQMMKSQIGETSMFLITWRVRWSVWGVVRRWGRMRMSSRRRLIMLVGSDIYLLICNQVYTGWRINRKEPMSICFVLTNLTLLSCIVVLASTILRAF